jgi:DNA repair protein RecO (recombination protein O)
MRTLKTEGVIIKRKNYSEADRILTVFTKYHGKIQVKASGIRRIPSRRASHVELLNFSTLTLYKGKGMPVLTEAQTIESYSAIKDNLRAIGDAYHLCELTDSLCPENQENSQVFDLLKDALNNLAFYSRSSDADIFMNGSHTTDSEDELILRDSGRNSFIRDFEIELLTTLGFYNQTGSLSSNFNTRLLIENILERKLKTLPIFAKLN